MSHSIGGSARLIWSSMWTGPVWSLRSCSISADALLQLRLALLELLHLLDDRVQPRRFLLRGGDVGVELRRLVAERSSSASR